MRLAQIADAEYLHSLRIDPEFNEYITPVDGGTEGQRRWLGEYKIKESENKEFYFIILNKDGKKCGCIRLYNIDEEKFTWGSWILDRFKPTKAALESAVLVYVVGFELLGLTRAVFDVRISNLHTLRFHDRFGVQRIGEDHENIYYEYSCETFAGQKQKFLEILSGGLADGR